MIIHSSSHLPFGSWSSWTVTYLLDFLEWNFWVLCGQTSKSQDKDLISSVKWAFRDCLCLYLPIWVGILIAEIKKLVSSIQTLLISFLLWQKTRPLNRQHLRMNSILFDPAALLYTHTQDGRPIEEYVEEFIGLTHLVPWSDGTLKTFLAWTRWPSFESGLCNRYHMFPYSVYWPCVVAGWWGWWNHHHHSATGTPEQICSSFQPRTRSWDYAP